MKVYVLFGRYCGGSTEMLDIFSSEEKAENEGLVYEESSFEGCWDLFVRELEVK